MKLKLSIPEGEELELGKMIEVRRYLGEKSEPMVIGRLLDNFASIELDSNEAYIFAIVEKLKEE